MANFTILYTNDDTRRTRKIGESDSLTEALKIREKKAISIIKKLECDEEDEDKGIATVSGVQDLWCEWNGHHFVIQKFEEV